MRIFLVGYMGSGKTRTGKKLAALTGYSFTDIDEMIEERYRISISDFFEKYGEESFRKIERAILIETLDIPDLIIATGGGTPCFFDNMELIRNSGISFYLRMDPLTLVKRLSMIRKKRPLLKEKSDSELETFVSKQLEAREAFYNRAHHIVTQESGAVEAIMKILEVS